MTEQEKITASKSLGRFKYLVLNSDDTEYGTAGTFYHAVEDCKKCKGEIWLAGRMVQSYKGA